MNHKFLTLVFSGIAYLSCFSQALQYRNFDFDDKAPAVNCSPAELNANKAIILDELKVKEIIITPKEDVEEYTFYYRAALINDPGIIDKFNKIYIPVSGSSELITLKCRVTLAGGKTIELFKGDMKQIDEDGKTYSILALEGLEKNAIIEYYYLKQIPVSYYSSEYVVPGYLVKKYTCKMIMPEKLVFETKSYNGMPKSKDTVLDNRNIQTFELKDLVPAEDEKYTTSYEKYPRYEMRFLYNINNTSKKQFTYSDFSKQLVRNYHEVEKNDEKTVASIYKKLRLDDLKTTDEKVFKIESYIKNDLGFIRKPGELTLTECIEKGGLSKFFQNKLTVLLLDKCKIGYEVISTTDITDKTFDPEFETYSFLTDILFYIPETKKYFSHEDLKYRYGEIQAGNTDQKGLFVKPLMIGDAYSAINSLKYIEPNSPDRNYENLNLNISFKPITNKLLLETSRTFNGYPAVNYRPFYFYNDNAKRQELLQGILKNGLQSATVSLSHADNFEMDDFGKYNQPFTCGGIVETTELTEVAGQNFIVKIGSCIGTQAELYQEQKRRFRIYTGYPHSYKRTIVFNVPQGYKAQGFEKLNMNVEMKKNNDILAFFKSNYVAEGDKITVTVEESYKKTFYEVEDFDGFRKVVNASADFNKITLLLKKN